MKFPSPKQLSNLMLYLIHDLGLNDMQAIATAEHLIKKDFFSGKLALLSITSENEIQQKLIPALPISFYEKTKN